MAWITPSAQNAFSQRFTAAERASLTALSGGDSSNDLLDGVVAEMRDVIRSGNYPLDQDGTLPSGLEQDCYSIFVWRFVTLASKNAALQTDARQKSYDAAIAKLKEIANSRYSIESPTGASAPASASGSGCWLPGRMF